MINLRQLKSVFEHNRFSLTDFIGEKNINLGCGNKPLDSFINADFYNSSYADITLDLNAPLPFKKNNIDLIYADNVFEHIKNYLQLVKECYMALKKGGYLIVRVPYFKSKHAFVDPTHINFFTIQSMDYFVGDTFFYMQYRFFDLCYDKLTIYLDPEKQNILKNIMKYIAIKRPNFFENTILSNLFVFHNITFVLRK